MDKDDRSARRNNLISERVLAAMERMKITGEKLARVARINNQHLNRVLKNRRPWTDHSLGRVAKALGVRERDLWEPNETVPEPKLQTNPKPVRMGNTLINEVCLMIGNHSEPLEISPQYTHELPVLPDDIKPVREALLAKAKENNRGNPYFNGPCVRLLRAHEGETYQADDGREVKRIVLELAPLPWFDHMVLNGFLDDSSVFPGDRRSTIRSRYGDPKEVFSKGVGETWCQLSNIFTVLMMPITVDGYGIVQLRSEYISFAPGLYISGVSENMHRFLDEMQGEEWGVPVHKLGTPRRQVHVDHLYRPPDDRRPSPLRTAMRGLYEEVAKEIGERLKASPHRFVFLNMIWGFTHFHPFLIGIIRLPWNRIETERLIQESPGKDHSEGTTHFFKLSMADPETAKLVAAKERWYLPGLSAFISSIKYWEDHGVGDSE